MLADNPQPLPIPNFQSIRRFPTTHLSDDHLQAIQHAYAALTRRIIQLFLKISALLFILLNLNLLGEVWITHTYPVSSYVAHSISSVLIIVGGWMLLRRDRLDLALLYIVSVPIIHVIIQVFLTREIAIIGFIAFVLALPSIVIALRWILTLMGVFSSAVIGILLIRPDLNMASGIGALLFIWAMMGGSLAIGQTIRRVLDDFLLTLVAHEQEAVDRVRSEEQIRQLLEAQRRVLFVKHDLRSPCDTVLGTIEVIKSLDLDRSTVRQFVLQLEPVVLQLRSRLDALFDDAKAPLLRSRAEFVVLDLRLVIRTAIPALQQMLAAQRTDLDLDLTFVDPTPEQLFLICGREGEIQRILENLIANAAAAQASAVAISLVLKEHGQVGLIVEDNGPGFPEWFLEGAPDNLRSTRHGGTGFGLLGVSANAWALHGRIVFDNGSALGGARIQIVFPYAKTPVQCL